jgi:hypothetical protein
MTEARPSSDNPSSAAMTAEIIGGAFLRIGFLESRKI